MAKNKLAKRNPSAPRKGLGVMKLGFDGREEIISKRFTDVDMVFIPMNLGGDHWIVARVDLRKKNVL
ncbi:hypothetical protein AB3S75_024813 [Citrus x aurantiifolia]